MELMSDTIMDTGTTDRRNKTRLIPVFLLIGNIYDMVIAGCSSEKITACVCCEG